MRFTRATVVRSLAVGIAGMALTGIAALPADAGTLPVTVNCESGGSRLLCVASGSGSQTSYVWTVNNVTFAGGPTLNRHCIAGQFLTGSVTGTDAAGNTGTADFAQGCFGGPPV